jgi:hypothetical protein
VQALGNIDVAEAGDQCLVEERRLQRRRLAGEEPGEQRAVERIAQRLDAQGAKQRVGRQVGPGTRVMKPNRRASL